MSYVKTAWVNGSQPYINAENLNKIEAGIETSDKFIGTGTDVGKALFTAKDAASARSTIGALATNGNAATAAKWATVRKITFTGGVSGSVSLDGSADVTTALTANIPKGAAVASLSTTATLEETIKQFNALLVSLRDAGLLTK